jgi:hypothetical protein
MNRICHSSLRFRKIVRIQSILDGVHVWSKVVKSALTLGDQQSRSSLTWLPVAMIGFGLPAIVVMLAVPSTSNLVRMAVGLMAAALCIASVAIYSVSVLFPGDVVSVTFDGNARTVQLVRINPFATKEELLSFDDVRDLASSIRYDDDGYSEETTELALFDGRTIRLPFAVSSADVVQVQTMLDANAYLSYSQRSR